MSLNASECCKTIGCNCDYIAGFIAYSNGAYFDCDWDPAYRDGSLGVFLVRKKGETK